MVHDTFHTILIVYISQTLCSSSSFQDTLECVGGWVGGTYKTVNHYVQDVIHEESLL